MKDNLELIKKVCPDVDFSSFSEDHLKHIPQHKQDLETALELVKKPYKDIEPLLPVLLTWLQDYNWPVAQTLAPYLAKMGKALKADVIKILNSEDEVWKHWVLVLLVDTKDLALARSIKPELEKLSREDSSEHIDDIAKEILEKI